MLGGWLGNKSTASGSKNDDNPNDQNTITTHSQTSLPGPSSQNNSSLFSGLEPQAIAPPLTTPHDAIVNEMNEKIRDLELASTSSRASKPEHDGDTRRTGIQPKTKFRLPDNFYDPFTGQSIGNYTLGEFPESENDLWSHLGKIRNLQCEIAVMHAQMEGLGTSERSLRTEQSMGDEDTMNLEEDVKEAKAEEFRRLANRFSGRKEAIDAIMAKLETLSHAINEFHSTREPVFRFGSRRSTVSEQESRRGKASSSLTPTKSDKREQPQTPTRILHDDVPLKETPESIPRSLEPA